MKTFSDIKKMKEFITSVIHIAKNVKGNLSGRNMKVPKRVKSIGNGNNVDVNVLDFFLLFQLFKKVIDCLNNNKVT